jgi:protein-L-isoaspartate O-methyltransferase
MPSEKSVLQQNLSHAYEHAFLDTGFEATIFGPHIVGRMTSNIDMKLGETILEIGIRSGYQSAYLTHLTNQRPALSRRRAAAHCPRRRRLLTPPNEKVVQSFGPGADRRCG